MLAGLGWKADVGVTAYDIVLVLSAREPEVLLPLVMRAAQRTDNESSASPTGNVTIHLFSRSPHPSFALPTAETQTGLTVDVKQQTGRLSKETFQNLGMEDVAEREVFVCGPEDFEEVALGALREVGVESHNVRREGFAY